jgi:hypothetical protein
MVGCFSTPGMAQAPDTPKKGSQPWWMAETAMSPSGALLLRDKPWWDRASRLKVGEQFFIEATGDAAGHMLVRRERFRIRTGQEVEAIVWVIDDDSDGSLAQGGDQDSDCYVVDYGCDGVVDRMVDYVDNDGDNVADEMDIRYFFDGELRFAWFGADYDHDGKMWSLRGYEYGGPSFFEGDPYGDNMIYMNKFNPPTCQWAPISECPFAFYDTDNDGFSETVVRVSAVPLSYDPNAAPDYANDYNHFRGKWSPEMEHMGIANIRYSFDVDGGSNKDTPLHYDFGFNLVGRTPYQFPEMRHFNPKRRSPQTTCVTPWKDLRKIADRFNAPETGLSWHENHDDTIAIGYGPHEKDDYRWEGVFWTWERRFMENTGGPCQKWNVRREWSRRPADKRELYYSEVDKRIHLFGAEEGWLEVGHFSGLGALGEIRMFDTDGNGFFDRWEVCLGDTSAPARVATVRDERARRIEWNPGKTSAFYTGQVLPQAMCANEKLMAAMKRLRPFEVPPGLATAMTTGSLNFRRYAQDVAREMQYRDLRDHFAAQANRLLRALPQDDLRRLKANGLELTRNSHSAWRLLRALSDLDVAYGQGDFDLACKLMGEIETISSRAK